MQSIYLRSDVHLVFPDTCTQGRVQFLIDALDRAVQNGETEVLINRFPIDLELELGAAFTERTTYTGVYNMILLCDLGFDMSFRVQCSENYYGPNCTTFCGSVQNLYTCDSVGSRICLERGRDPATNCTECLVPGYDPSTDCTECLPNIQCQTTATTSSM